MFAYVRSSGPLRHQKSGLFECISDEEQGSVYHREKDPMHLSGTTEVSDLGYSYDREEEGAAGEREHLSPRATDINCPMENFSDSIYKDP